MSKFDRFRPSATEPVPGDEFAWFRLSAVRPASKTVEDPFDITTEGWKINKGLPPVPESPAAVPSWLPKIPYSGIEGAPTGEESPAPFREAIAAAARSSVGQPFVKQYDTVRGSFLKGGAALTRGVTDIGEYVGKPMGIPRSEVFDKAAQMWQDKGEELHQLAQEKGADFVDKMVGSAVGGGVPGVAEFMLNVPYYSFKGAIEAAKRGDNQAWGAIVGGAKRYALGETLHAAGTLTKPLAIPAMGTVMGVQTAAEGGTPEETAEAVGTGMIFGATGAPGRTGARDVGRTIYEGIDRLVRSKKPITVETPPVMPPAPPSPLLGTPITPDATPTPPPASKAPVPPSAAPGTPEFYKAEAAKLSGDVRYVGEMGGRPMFQDEGGAGSFMKAPEETVQEALVRARARYEMPQPTAEAGPVAVPEPISLTKEAPVPPELSGVQPPPPPEGGLFAKGEEGFAPEGDFREKPGEPIDEGKPMSRSSIAKFLSEKFDIPLRVGRFRSALGIFKVGPEVIRTRFAYDIEVISHEIGHALHKFLWPEARTGSGGLAAGPLRAFQDELIPIATKPRAGGSKTAEGFAEFIRKYVVNPDEAKQVAPKFFKFFEEQLDAKSPDSKAILLKARADYKRWLEQPALARVMGSINQTPAAGAALSFKKLYASVIDTFFPVEEITKEMAKVKRIDEVPANLNPYKLMHLLAGYKGKLDAWLEFKPYSFKTYKFSETVKSFKRIMEPIKKSRDIFDAYLVSRRSVQLGETRTGILDADARKVIEDMDREHPEFKQAAIELKHYQNGLLRYLYDGGIINGEQFLRMRQANEDYVPFYRVMDYERVGGGAGSGSGHEVKGAPVYRFKGSWRDIVSPTESIIKNTCTFIQAVEKNAIGKALVDLSKQKEGMGKFIEKIPADTQRIAVKDTELEDMLRKYGKWTETTQFQTTERVIRESIKDETGADIPAGERGTKLMKERAVEALKSRGYSEAEANTIVGRIASAKNETARSRIIERVTERATVRNTVREFGIDIPEGLAYIYRKSPNTPKGNVITVMERGKPTFYEVDERIYNAFHALDKEGANALIRILSIPAKMLRVGATLTPEFSLGKNPIRDQWTAFINSKYGYIPGVDLAKGLFMAVKKNEDYWRWKIGGGEHSAMVSMDREYLDKTWKEVMRDRGVKADAIHLATHPIDVLRALSEFTEEATRLGEFRKGLKAELAAGKNLKTATQDAAYASREVTLPFSRMGAKTKAVNMIVAFWNANVQDLDKIHRQFKEYPLQTSIRTMAAITLPSVLLAIVNHSNKKIDEIAQWQKDIFWLVDVGPFVMRIPKPFIMGILFGSFPERIVNNIMDKDPRAFDGLLDSLSRGASPGWMPTFANPIIENWANKSTFTDRAIVPKAREDVLPQYQYAPYTTETAKKIGSLMAKIPGIKGSNLEAQIVSPAKFENMIRGWTGGLGMWALQAANASLKTAGLVPARVEPSKQLADYPFIKAFVVRYPTADSESIQRFFDDYKEAETNLKSAKLLMKRGEFADASDLLLNEEVVRLVSVKKALTNAHRLVDLIYENPNILPDEKRRMIDETYLNMTAIAREGNKTLDAYKDRRKAQTP